MQLADNAGGVPPKGGATPTSGEAVLAENVAEAAAALGIRLSQREVEAYLPFVAEQLRLVDSFLAAPVWPSPGVRPLTGFPPTPADDPYRAWLWRCKLRESTAGLLAGCTVSFKDHISVAGLPQSFATETLEDFVPDEDATVVARALGAGATVLGKNTMSGFTADFPRAINPRDTTRSTGGSSSGSAVAVAAGEVDLAFGGDQGGSVRLPAAFCGVLGLKPTFGLISHHGAAFGADPSLDHIGLLASDVEYLARGIQAVAGVDGLDPRQRPGWPDGIDALTDLEAGLAGLRVGLLQEGFERPLDQAVWDGVSAAVEVLRGLGAQVVTISVPEHRHVGVACRVLAMEGARAIFATGMAGFGARTQYPAATIAAVQAMWHDHSDRLTESTTLYHLTAELSRRRHNGTGYARAQNTRPRYEQAYNRVLTDVDVLLMPTVRTEAPAAEPPREADLDALPAALIQHWMGASTLYNLMPFNYTGHPALAVPCQSPSPLPASMQLVGRQFQDGLLLRIARAYLSQTGGPA